MAKLPAFQFYPGDWLRDNISGCSLAAQGLWLRMMILMHDSERYGYIQMNGAAMPPETIARRCGCTLDEYTTLLCELTTAGIPSLSIEGIIYSRRMVRDAREREKTRERVVKSREKGKCNATCNGDVTPHVTPMYQHSSSSSSSSEDLNPQPPLPKGESPPESFACNFPSQIPQAPDTPSDNDNGEFREVMLYWLAKIGRMHLKGRERENLSDALASHGLAWVKAAMDESKSTVLFKRFEEKEERERSINANTRQEHRKRAGEIEESTDLAGLVIGG